MARIDPNNLTPDQAAEIADCFDGDKATWLHDCTIECQWCYHHFHADGDDFADTDHWICRDCHHEWTLDWQAQRRHEDGLRWPSL